jgi:hypothetical protein
MFILMHVFFDKTIVFTIAGECAAECKTMPWYSLYVNVWQDRLVVAAVKGCSYKRKCSGGVVGCERKYLLNAAACAHLPNMNVLQKALPNANGKKRMKVHSKIGE